MKRTIILELTEKQALAVSKGLRSAIDFMDSYYMFGYKDSDYNSGSLPKEKKLSGEARKVIDIIEGNVQPPHGIVAEMIEALEMAEDFLEEVIPGDEHDKSDTLKAVKTALKKAEKINGGLP